MTDLHQSGGFALGPESPFRSFPPDLELDRHRLRMTGPISLDHDGARSVSQDLARQESIAKGTIDLDAPSCGFFAMLRRLRDRDRGSDSEPEALTGLPIPDGARRAAREADAILADGLAHQDPASNVFFIRYQLM